MERTLIIKEFLGLVGLTKEERVALIRTLMYEWRLTEQDITVQSISDTETPSATDADQTPSAPEIPKQESDEPQPEPVETETEGTALQQEPVEAKPKATPVKRGGRPRKTVTAPPKEPTAETAEAQPQAAPVKRRGRPRKNPEPPKLPQTQAEKPTNTPKINLSAQDEKLIREASETKDIRSLLEDKPRIRQTKVPKRHPAFCELSDYPELQKKRIGQEYSYKLLYRWDNKNILSGYVLADLMPIGIYIPYSNVVHGGYIGFIMSIYDERIIKNVHEAISDAQKKMPAIDNEEWSVMDSLQFGTIKMVSEVLNRILSKVGGDRLRQTYKRISYGSTFVTGVGDFRYTINVKGAE